MTSVLFIGNSYTSCNDLPGTVRHLASAAGHDVQVEMVAPGGMTLEEHWYHADSRVTLASRNWDFVVFQEQSTEPVEDPDCMLKNAVRLCDSIGGAKPVLYLTWARRHMPEMQEALTRAYRNAAEKTGALLAPVGPAWELALAASPALSLHADDNSHPTPLGTYLAALVISATLFDIDPLQAPETMPLPPESCLAGEAWITIDKEPAGKLKKAAEEAT